MRSGGGVLRMKHLICPFWPCRACWVWVLEIMGGPVETGEAAGTPWHWWGWGLVRGALDSYWGPSLKGRDGETAPSLPVMESIEWRLWALLVFAKPPQSTRVPPLCTPIPDVKGPASTSLVSLASEKGCKLQKPSRIPSHLVFLFCALPDSLSSH